MHRNPDCPRKTKRCCFGQFSMFRFIFFQNWLLPTRSKSNRLCFWKSIVLKNYQFFSCIGTLTDHKARSVCDMNSSRFSNSCFPKYLNSIDLSSSQSEAFYLFWRISLNFIVFVPKKVLLFWKCVVFHTHISSLLYLLRFFIKESIDSFFHVRRTIWFYISWKLFSRSKLNCW